MPTWPIKGADKVQLREFDFYCHAKEFLPYTPTRLRLYLTFYILLNIILSPQRPKPRSVFCVSEEIWDNVRQLPTAFERSGNLSSVLRASFWSISETQAHFLGVFVEHQGFLELLQECHTHWEPLGEAVPSVFPSEHCEILDDNVMYCYHSCLTRKCHHQIIKFQNRISPIRIKI